MTTRKYRDDSRSLLAQARAELAGGDVRQASEKGWGAAAQIVKAVSESRGSPHRGHRLLFNMVDTLYDETGDADIRRLFNVANALHMNFYEDWRSSESVGESLDDVERFLDKMDPLVSA